MNKNIDEAFLPLSDLVAQLSDLDGRVGDIVEKKAITMEIEEASLGLPIQMEILIDEEGKIILGGTPPVYYFETSVLPVFHQIRLRLEPESKIEHGKESSLAS